MSPALRRGLAVAAFFLGLSVALRWAQLGNPAMQIDEQFYLLVGDRMWHGALPYMHFWDRKPIGLFLIYAATRLLGGDGVLQYQIVAACSAAATAVLVWRLASRIAPQRGAMAAGAIYLIWLMVNGGEGGQAPVFYNLLVAGAALAVVCVIERPTFDRAALGWACAAMALSGAALQVKYSVLFEGVFFGLTLLAVASRRGVRPTMLLAAAGLWIALALTPTALAGAWYWQIGQLDAFLFANFESIFLRSPYQGDTQQRLFKIAARLGLPAAAALGGWWISGGARGQARLFLGLWTAVAIASLIAFGTYHDHYALAPLLPITILGAPAFAWAFATPRKRLRVTPVAVAVGLAGLIWGGIIVKDGRWRRGDGIAVRALAAPIAPGDTLFVFSGDPALYHLSAARIPTAWNFPTLLSERRDSHSLGIDMHAELARVMAARPHFVATRSGYPFPEADPAAWQAMQAMLARDYALVVDRPVGPQHRLLYQRVAH